MIIINHIDLYFDYSTLNNTMYLRLRRNNFIYKVSTDLVKKIDPKISKMAKEKLDYLDDRFY